MCIGCGRCEEICPSVFHINEEIGKSEVIDLEACDYAGCCEAAWENCPVETIFIEGMCTNLTYIRLLSASEQSQRC